VRAADLFVMNCRVRWTRALRALSPPYVLFAVLCLLSAVYAAEPLEPGLWKVVTRVDMNGMQGPAETKTRCLKPDDAQDLERTFAPEYRVQGATCERMNLAWAGQQLSWRVQCTGPLTMEVAGTYEFDTPRHYSGVVTTFAAMAGREVRTRTTLEAEHIGECQPDDRGQRSEDRK
jgi:hypothetical protein